MFRGLNRMFFMGLSHRMKTHYDGRAFRYMVLHHRNPRLPSNPAKGRLPMPHHANATSFQLGNKFGAKPRTRKSIRTRTLTSKRARMKRFAALGLIVDEMATRKLQGETIDEVKYAALMNAYRQESKALYRGQ